MEMSERVQKLDFPALLQESFELLKNHWALLVPATLLAIIISICTLLILAGPMAAGMAYIILALRDRRTSAPEIGDLFKGFDYFLPSLLFVVCGLAVGALSSMLFQQFGSIVSLLFNTVTYFTIYLIVDQRRDFWPAITESYEVVKHNFLLFLGLAVVGALISVAGVLACCIGMVFTLPFYQALAATTYRKVFPEASATADDPQVLPPDDVTTA